MRILLQSLMIAAVVFPAAAEEPSPEMLAAGAAALRGMVQDPAGVAGGVYAAMAGAAWRPIESAPQDGRDMLLGLFHNGEFLRGIGRWQVYDEPDKPGFWSVTDWFGAPPAFWMPLPDPPKTP